MIRTLSSLFLLFLSLWSFSQDNSYEWLSPSANSSESMPCGGGDTGLNVWVENGDLLFYISRSGTYDEQNTLLKQGRVRVRLHPDPFLNARDFSQKLHLDKGHMEIRSNGTSITIWADVFKPVIHVGIQSKTKISAEIHYENWRYRDRLLGKGESQQNSYKWAPPSGLDMTADSIVPTVDRVLFYHQNSAQTVFDVAVEQQDMQKVKEQMMNPLAKLISGGILWSDCLRYQETDSGTYAGTDFKAWVFKTTKPTRNLSFAIALHTAQASDIRAWEKELANTVSSINIKTDRQKSASWWKAYNERSFIHAGGELATASLNYRLFRYMLGCNAHGSDPTKFNGGLFTFDPVYVDLNQAFTPDYRKWGGGTMTAQNQRLVYWPMLKNGDSDLMKPQFDFYLRMLKNAELRSQVYWNHPGACFAEQIENFGLPNPSEYGWKRPETFDRGVEYNAWLEYEWETVLEFCQMILETKNYNQADISPYMPLIKSAVQFFDEHYRYLASRRGRKSLDANGHLVIFPGSACETYKMAYNPAGTIAGLKRILLTLNDPDSLLSKIPPIPVREINGNKMIAPAMLWERVNNTETPQLYPVFPWRFYGMGRDDLDIARNTYLYDPDAVKFRSHKGWKQDNIWAACLGLTDEAVRLTIEKMSDGPHRFPAFQGPDFDWTPDHNRLGSGMIGMQEMLLQTTDDGKILLFPAWPRTADVHFKLHAPRQTTVEAELKGGKITKLIVCPEERKQDVEILLP